MALVSARALSKTYRVGEIDVPALRHADFDIEPASFVCFVGPSGSGKSTLLNLIGCLDVPSGGQIKVLDTDIARLNRTAQAAFRGAHIGFVFQDFNLIPVLSAFENVEYPLVMVQHWPPAKRRERVEQVLAAVGMGDQAAKRPDQLSGGQKQRVAVARALVAAPKLVLADEPTANLDHDTALRIIALMKSMRDEFGTTFVFSTHDPKIVEAAEVVFRIEDGRVERQAADARPRAGAGDSRTDPAPAAGGPERAQRVEAGGGGR